MTKAYEIAGEPSILLRVKPGRNPTTLPWPAGKAPSQEFCDEASRAFVLESYGLDALEDDEELAGITRFAAQLCGAPIALVSLVEKERQRFLSREGLKERETPRSTSFCAHAMLHPEPMVVRDATQDPRFADNPLVTKGPGIRFYAGAPLVSDEGAPLGSLCVIDTEPRPEGLDDLQIAGLRTLAAAVMRRLRNRRDALEAQGLLHNSEKQLRMLADNMPDLAWSCDAEGNFDFYNARWKLFTGIDGPKNAEGWRQLVHPDDEAAAMDLWYRCAGEGIAFDAEYRMMHTSGEWRWVLSRAHPLRDPAGEIERWFGTVTDIDVSRKVSEQRDLLARELSHRIKNIFAVVSSLVSLHARNLPEVKPFTDNLTAAIAALGRAHDYVRPLDGRKSDNLAGLIKELMEPYRLKEIGHITISGDKCRVGASAATPMALVFHELATNSAKYGALSSAQGTIDVVIGVDEEEGKVSAVWRERGGPAPKPGAPEGFGSRLLRMSVEGQLGGTIKRRWTQDGVVVELSAPIEAIST